MDFVTFADNSISEKLHFFPQCLLAIKWEACNLLQVV